MAATLQLDIPPRTWNRLNLSHTLASLRISIKPRDLMPTHTDPRRKMAFFLPLRLTMADWSSINLIFLIRLELRQPLRMPHFLSSTESISPRRAIKDKDSAGVDSCSNPSSSSWSAAATNGTRASNHDNANNFSILIILISLILYFPE